MKNTRKEKGMVGGEHKRILGIIGVVAVVLSIGLLGIFFRAYSSAKKNYEQTIASLQTQVEQLSDPVATYEEASREVDVSLLSSRIEGIGELATIDYLYTNTNRYEDAAQWFGRDIPLSITTKSFIMTWDGIIKAGIDLNQVKVNENAEKREIVIELPKARILSHEIEEDSVEVLDQNNGLFNLIKVEDVKTFDAVSKETMEKRAIENGILEKAEHHTEAVIEQLVNTMEIKDAGYTITFRIMGE